MGSTPVIAITGLLMLLGLLVGGVVVLVALLANKQTRPFALGMLGVGGVLAALILAALVTVRIGGSTANRQAVAEVAAVQTYADAHGHTATGVPAPHGASQHWTTYAPYSAASAQPGLRASWALILLVFVGLAALYGMMKLLNNRDGKGGLLAVGAALGLAIFAGLMVLNFTSRPRPQPAQVVAAAADDWEELTRPRIQLSDGPPVKYQVVVNGRELTFSSDTPVSKALDEIKKIYLEDNQQLTIRAAQTTSSMGGSFERAQIGDLLYQALAQARVEQAKDVDPAETTDDQLFGSAETEEQTGRVTLEYQDTKDGDVSINIASSVSNEGVANEIATRQKQLAGDKMLVKIDEATMTFTAATPKDAIVQAVNAARDLDQASDEPAEPKRPDWIDEPSKRIGDVYRQVVEVGPYTTAEECYQQLATKLSDITAKYAQEQSLFDCEPDQLPQFGITPAYLMREACAQEFLETFYSESVGQDMKRLYVQVEFDQPFRDRLQQAHQLVQQTNEVSGLTLLGCGVLALVGGAFGLLKTDEATGGRYRKRLFLGVPAAIIGLSALVLA